MRLLLIILLSMLFCQCTTQESDPQVIINKVLKASGSAVIEKATIAFDFRDRRYSHFKNGGQFIMTRSWEEDTLGQIMDEITNEGFTRTINGIAKEVADTMAVKYANSINSVHYFALLPYRLNDPAVIKKFLGEDVINKVGYYKISITFQQEGGGQDHEDEFIYWINKQNYFIDYLAYSYLTEGGGMRFREAYNTRTINGLRIVDYINYKPLQAVSLESMGTSYEQGMLKEVSKIDLENVSINMN